ncbi:MAG: phosphoribosyl-AMP cyclohydrolase [Planctomycetes bacterium]|nr:phosphoribosyl-AMP cyclohydrolase [Planctomycetota bacterium]
MNGPGDALAWGRDGLLPVVAQDERTGEVLMLAWADREALERTVETGFAHYFSRSRKALWKKGETSGNVQRVVEVRADCDGDALLYRVEQTGGACHEGYSGCFYRHLSGDAWAIDRRKVFNPAEVYPPDAARPATLDTLRGEPEE